MRKKSILLIIGILFLACSDVKSKENNTVQEIHKSLDVRHNNTMGISIYYKSGIEKRPTIYFFAASVSDRRVYEHLYYALVKEGYVVVGVSTESFASDFMSYHFYDAFKYAKSICDAKGLSDNSRIGLAGHSSGAGFLPSLGYQIFTVDKLGENGRFIFGASPWIDFQYKEHMTLPKDTNFVTELFEHDYSTDPRIYLDMYKHISVENKAFITVKMGGNHQTIFYPKPKKLVEASIYKPLKDLANYSFNKTNKEAIFSKKGFSNKYISIDAENTLPSDRFYNLMLRRFQQSRSSFGCKASKGYAPNPREKQCLNYVNKY